MAQNDDPIRINRLNVKEVEITIEGKTPLVVHRMSEKARKQLGGAPGSSRGKRKQRDARDPEAEYRGSMYILEDESYGFPASKIKAAMVGAAHKDLGIPKTQVRQALFIHADDTWLVRIDCPTGPKMREDVVRYRDVPDLRYRGEFWPWSIALRMEIDLDLLSIDDAVNLLERAGNGIGIGEGRPQKSDLGWGRFRVKR